MKSHFKLLTFLTLQKENELYCKVNNIMDNQSVTFI